MVAALDIDLDGGIGDAAVLGEGPLEWGKLDARTFRIALRLARDLLGARGDDLREFRVRHHLVDQLPVGGALALHAFLGGAKHVGKVAADLALVGDAGEAACARQHGEQRHLGQGDVGGAVVGQDDVVAGQRQLVAAAGTGATHGADIMLAGFLPGRLEGVARLVGELAEIDLVGVRGARQHADIGAGAEDALLARLQHHGLHLRTLEAHALDDVGQLDVDAEVVGIQLQLIAFEQAAILVDIHEEVGDRPVIVHAPMAIARRIDLEIDGLRHGLAPPCWLHQL